MPKATKSRPAPTPLPEHCPLQRQDVLELAKNGRIKQASFVAGNYGDGDENGMILVVRFTGKLDHEITGPTGIRTGILYKQDQAPRVFQTPETIMGNARKLGITTYQIEAEAWKADYYSPYKAQAASHAAARASK